MSGRERRSIWRHWLLGAVTSVVLIRNLLIWTAFTALCALTVVACEEALPNPQEKVVAQGPPLLSISGVREAEGNSGTIDAVFTVKLNLASTQVVTVDYATSDGTAEAGFDYTAANGTLTIEAGATVDTITVGIIGDTAVEQNETFTVTLRNALNAVLWGHVAATGVITDNDEASLTITDTHVSEGNRGSTDAVFTVTLNPASTQQVTVDYATSDGTAEAGFDYIAANGTLTIDAGATLDTITVGIIGDTAVEQNETFTVTLEQPIGALIERAKATGTVANDDVPFGPIDAPPEWIHGTWRQGSIASNNPFIFVFSSTDVTVNDTLGARSHFAATGRVWDQMGDGDSYHFKWSGCHTWHTVFDDRCGEYHFVLEYYEDGRAGGSYHDPVDRFLGYGPTLLLIWRDDPKKEGHVDTAGRPNSPSVTMYSVGADRDSY